jgi:hypothetical protein
MTTKDDLIYRQVFTLRDGARVLVRPLTTEDRQALLELFLPVTAEDRHYIRHDVSNPDIVNAWIDNLNYDKVLPLVAEVNHRIVGEATCTVKVRPPPRQVIYLAKNHARRWQPYAAGLIEWQTPWSHPGSRDRSDQSQMIKAFSNPA